MRARVTLGMIATLALLGGAYGNATGNELLESVCLIVYVFSSFFLFLRVIRL